MILDNKSLLLENVVELEIFTDYLRHLLKILTYLINVVNFDS